MLGALRSCVKEYLRLAPRAVCLLALEAHFSTPTTLKRKHTQPQPMALKRASTLIKYLLPVVLAFLLGASLRGIDFDKDTNADWAEVRGAQGGPRPARVGTVEQPGRGSCAQPENIASTTGC